MITIAPVAGLPEICAGDELAELIVAAGASLRDDNILVVAHKAVSKAEGRFRELAAVTPGERARKLAAEMRRDPRLVQVILDESIEILRAERAILICRTAHGMVCANAGVDLSNVGGGERALLLPSDPDASARRLRAALREHAGAAPAVVIADSFGRAWRNGQVDVAIGCAGVLPLDDWRGRRDRAGLELRATWLAVADSVAAAADLARTKISGDPIVVVSGLGRHVIAGDGPGARALARPPGEDLFR